MLRHMQVMLNPLRRRRWSMAKRSHSPSPRLHRSWKLSRLVLPLKLLSLIQLLKGKQQHRVALRLLSPRLRRPRRRLCRLKGTIRHSKLRCALLPHLTHQLSVSVFFWKYQFRGQLMLQLPKLCTVVFFSKFHRGDLCC